MCLIIRCDKNKPLAFKHLRNMYRRNDDGYGFMWIQNNAIHGLKVANANVNDLWNKYQELKEYDPVIHLRMRTHGGVNEENSHPYYCGYGIWMMHNGILHHSTISASHAMSDTWQFIEQVLKPLFAQAKNPHTLIRTLAFKHLVEEFIGAGNRIVLGDRGGFIYFNEKTWYTVPEDIEEINGIIVSNTYAWDVGEFKKKYQPPNHTSSYQNGSGKSSSIYGENSATSTTWKTPGASHISSTGATNFTHLLRGYYMDPWKGVWVWNGYTYSRRRDLDDREDLKELITKYEGAVPIQFDTFNGRRRSNISNDPAFEQEDEDGFTSDESAMLLLPYNATPDVPKDDSKDEKSKEETTSEVNSIPTENASKSIDTSKEGNERTDGEDDTQTVDFDEIEEYVRLEVLCKDWSTLTPEELEEKFWNDNEEVIKAFHFLLQTMPVD